jgi:hypothetical protein
MTDTPQQKVFDGLSAREPIADGPGVFVKPRPDCGKQVAGENVDVGINYRGKRFRNIPSFFIIDGWEMWSQHAESFPFASALALPCPKKSPFGCRASACSRFILFLLFEFPLFLRIELGLFHLLPFPFVLAPSIGHGGFSFLQSDCDFRMASRARHVKNAEVFCSSDNGLAT